MKTLILLSTLLTSAAPAFAALNCTEREAQVIGQVVEEKTVPVEGGEFCFIRIENYRHYNVHGICPLEMDEVMDKYIQDNECHAIGSEVSGVITMDASGRPVLNK